VDLHAARQRWARSAARPVVSAAALTAVLVGGSYGEAHPANPRDQVQNGHAVPHTPAAAFLLVALAGLVLAGRHRRPVAVLVVCTAAVAAYTALGYVNGAALLAPPVALYAVATRRPARQALGWAAGTLVVLLGVTAAANPFGPTGGGFDLIPFLVAAGALGGVAVANRRAYVASVATSAAARAEAEAQRRVDDERLRIARELHDVVAHTMATINVQAGVAAHLLAGRSDDPAARALTTIKEASRDGLRELRAILNVLRRADDAEPTAPAPGLDRLDELVAGTCRAGLATSLEVAGTRRRLPPAVDLAAYRVVQEALTNAIRHAGPATARVFLDYVGDRLRIEVTDTGAGPVPAGGGTAGAGGAGHGLAGMRERAAAVGGTLDAGPGSAGGFRVRAELPLSAPAGRPAAGPPLAVP
jgi:signal transduction histidine kinase